MMPGTPLHQAYNCNPGIDFAALQKKNRKRMWEYDWTLLIPETHKEIGSMF